MSFCFWLDRGKTLALCCAVLLFGKPVPIPAFARTGFLQKHTRLLQFHQVHHADVAIDVTTAIRFHPVEIELPVFWKMV